MTAKELKEYLDKFPDNKNVGFTVAAVKDRKAWPNCEISSECLAGNRPMILLELHERFWNPTEEGKCNGMWIPIEERMPEPESYILVSLENCTIPDIATYRVDDDGSGAFYQGDEDYTYLPVGLFVNAWMPLPEPYRG